MASVNLGTIEYAGDFTLCDSLYAEIERARYYSKSELISILADATIKSMHGDIYKFTKDFLNG